MAAILRDSTVVVAVVVVVRTRPRAIPLAMITMRKSTHGFPFVSHMSMGLRLAELRYKLFIYLHSISVNVAIQLRAWAPTAVPFEVHASLSGKASTKKNYKK